MREEAGISLNKATPEQILVAAKIELRRAIQRLSACQHRLYRETGIYPDDLGAAIQRLEFLLYGILAGLISPGETKVALIETSPKKDRERIQ